tara:strand:- start:241 stop:714 length:474 start_codon:yes stop_codon:yes gene_type:complete
MNISIIDIVVAAILVNTFVEFIILTFKRGGKYIREWYKNFKIGAYFMDIISAIIAVFLSTILTKNIKYQILLVIIIGLLHDSIFGYFVKNSGIKTGVINLFKNYANEVGVTILIVDAIMLVATLLFTYILRYYLNREVTILIGFIVFYIGLLIIYSF